MSLLNNLIQFFGFILYHSFGVFLFLIIFSIIFKNRNFIPTAFTSMRWLLLLCGILFFLVTNIEFIKAWYEGYYYEQINFYERAFNGSSLLYYLNFYASPVITFFLLVPMIGKTKWGLCILTLLIFILSTFLNLIMIINLSFIKNEFSTLRNLLIDYAFYSLFLAICHLSITWLFYVVKLKYNGKYDY